MWLPQNRHWKHSARAILLVLIIALINGMGLAAPRSYVSAQQVTHGLSGDYFQNKDLTGLVLTRVDPQVAFTWGTSSPDASIAPTTFSVRWTGFVVPRYTEMITFVTQTDDGARLWVNNQLLINDWNDHPITTNSGSIALVAGNQYSIRLEYYQGYGASAAKLLWQSQSQLQEVIPSSQLFAAPSPSSTPTILGTRTPTRTSTYTPTASRTQTRALTPTATPTNTQASTALASATFSRTPTPSSSATPSSTLARTKTPTLTPTYSTTKSPTATQTRTITPSPTTVQPAGCPPAILPPPTNLVAPASQTHRIGIRDNGTHGKFFDRSTSITFVPRGNNYIRLASETFCNGNTIQYHSTFNPGQYDHARYVQSLNQMHANGYNVVRVFLNNCCSTGGIGNSSGGLSAPYLDNIVDFLQVAKVNGIYVILTTDGLPEAGGYANLVHATAQIQSRNANYLTSSGIAAEQRYWHDVLQGLLARSAPLDTILAYELRNEQSYQGAYPPFSLNSGTLTAPNGITYDLTVFSDKVRLADEGLAYWLNQVRASILVNDPSALVTIGFATTARPDATKPFPNPYAPVTAVLADQTGGVSSADFVDLHWYPLQYPLTPSLRYQGITGNEHKPLILGEFGAFNTAYSTVSYAAGGMHDLQLESCANGFDGWLLWTWDSNEQAQLWNALSNNGALNNLLAPSQRPDPCTSSGGYGTNVAAYKPVTVSTVASGYTASAAVDQAPLSSWKPSAVAPQWIEINLQSACTISQVRLVPEQPQAGATDVRVWGKSATGNYQLLHEFVGSTSSGQVLDYTPSTGWSNMQYVKIETVAAPGILGWREITLLSR